MKVEVLNHKGQRTHYQDPYSFHFEVHLAFQCFLKLYFSQDYRLFLPLGSPDISTWLISLKLVIGRITTEIPSLIGEIKSWYRYWARGGTESILNIIELFQIIPTKRTIMYFSDWDFFVSPSIMKMIEGCRGANYNRYLWKVSSTPGTRLYHVTCLPYRLFILES